MKKLGDERENLDQMVYERLKTMIIERDLKPGDKIYQERIAHELGVSRTPLVNALKKLNHEKLVTAIARRGFFVRYFSKKEMIQIFELRELLEGLAARRAAQQISEEEVQALRGFFTDWIPESASRDQKKYAQEDRRFHNFLFEIGGKEFLAEILRTFNLLTMSYQVDRKTVLVRPPKETLSEHRAIIDAICNRDPVKSEEETRAHLRRSREKLLQEVGAEKDLPAYESSDGEASIPSVRDGGSSGCNEGR